MRRLLPALFLLLALLPAAAGARTVAFQEAEGAAAGTCTSGDAGTWRVVTAATGRCPEAAPARAIGILAPDETASGTALSVRRVAIVGTGPNARLRIVVARSTAPAEGFTLPVLTTPRTWVHVGTGKLPKHYVLVDPTGRVLARG